MVHAKDVVRIGIVTTALIFGWAVMTSPGVATANPTSESGATGSHAPRSGRPAPKPRPRPAAAAAAVVVAGSSRPQIGHAKPVTPTKATAASTTAPPPTPSSIVSDVTACACNLVKAVATQAAVFIAQLRPPTVPSPPPGPPVAWAVLAWVRKQVDDAIGQIATLPVVKHVVQAVSHIAGQTYDAIMACGAAPPTRRDVFDRTTIASGLGSPTDFALLPDGRILIAEKAGAVLVHPNGALTPDPLVVLPTQTQGERGLLGIEADPDFVDNGYIYVAYTTADTHYQLSRLTVAGDAIDPDSEVALFRSADTVNTNHQGGDLLFGPDGMLYWGIGDNTVGTNAQDLSNIHGKILRLNPVDGSAPQDNPFVGASNAVPQIWAYGLRNPFRLAFTPDGQLLAGDVGNNAVEELDLVKKGANYGWPGAEGVCASCTSVNPIYTYDHSGGSAAITSVLVYTGDHFGPSYQGKVFIADYIRGWIKALTFTSGYSTFIGAVTFDDVAGSTVKLAQGPDGNIYQLTIYPGELSVLTPAD